MEYIVEIIKAVSPNRIESFIHIAMILLIIWMYKENRSSYLERTKVVQRRTDEALERFSELDLEIYRYLNNTSDFSNVLEKMARSTSLMPYNLLIRCNRIKMVTDHERSLELIKEFQTKLEDEIEALKLNQYDPITYKSLAFLYYSNISYC